MHRGPHAGDGVARHDGPVAAAGDDRTRPAQSIKGKRRRWRIRADRTRHVRRIIMSMQRLHAGDSSTKTWDIVIVDELGVFNSGRNSGVSLGSFSGILEEGFTGIRRVKGESNRAIPDRMHDRTQTVRPDCARPVIEMTVGRKLNEQTAAVAGSTVRFTPVNIW